MGIGSKAAFVARIFGRSRIWGIQLFYWVIGQNSNMSGYNI
jgi:hypothetical protein